MLVAILLCAVTLAAAQQPKPCNSPMQFEARIYRSDFSKNFTQYAKLSYDETGKRVREVEEVTFGPDREFYDVLYLHNQNMEYRLNIKTRKCNRTSITRPFMPFGIPPNAQYDGEGNVGPVNIPNEHATVIRFHGKDERNDEFYGSVTSPDCIPVNSGFYSERTKFVHTTFYDVTLGIPDPTVFIPPTECQG